MVESVLVMLSPAFCDFGWWLVISLAAALSENLYRWEQPGALAGGGREEPCPIVCICHYQNSLRRARRYLFVVKSRAKMKSKMWCLAAPWHLDQSDPGDASQTRRPACHLCT